MTKKCIGCGIKLQSEDSKKNGFTPDITKDLCERCFKLKNYNILTTEGVKIDNNKIIEKINMMKATVLYLVDFLNIDKEIIDTFKNINNEKYLIVTKSDLIPKNIKVNVFVNNLKNIYGINEYIIVCSSKTKLNMNILTSIIKKSKNVVMAGFTNAGKSSLINTLINSDITVSRRSNTTQDFIKLNVEGVNVIDAPGFMSKCSRDNFIPKSIIKPKTYQLASKYYLNIGNIKLNIKNDSNITVYVGNEVNIQKRKELNNVECKILVPSNSDLILKGIGFIKFVKATFVNVTCEYEIRPSLVGGNNE